MPDAEVLFVAHHGSNTSTCKELLEAITPETAVISVGYNTYGHPTQKVTRPAGKIRDHRAAHGYRRRDHHRRRGRVKRYGKTVLRQKGNAARLRRACKKSPRQRPGKALSSLGARRTIFSRTSFRAWRAACVGTEGDEFNAKRIDSPAPVANDIAEALDAMPFFGDRTFRGAARI